MEIELLVAYVVLASSAVALLAGLCFWASIGADHVHRAPAAYKWPWSLRWMVCLVVATGSLLGAQILLGVTVSALALLADSAHGAADLATFTLAAFVEYAKFRFGSRAVSTRTSAMLDRASACFSVVVVMMTSACVCFEAVSRLKTPGLVQENGLGTSMMLVAGLGMALNLSLLWLRSYMQEGLEAEEGQRLGRPRSEQDAGPDGAALPEGVPSPPEGAQRRHSGAAMPEGVPSPVEGAPRRQGRRAPSSKAGPGRGGTYSTAASTFRKGIHAAFHPGCMDPACLASKAGSDDEFNFNLYGVVLHVAADVVRTLLMFVAGTLVRAGVFANSAKVDAACSFLIAALVTLGSAWLLGVACSWSDLPHDGGAALGEGSKAASYGAA